MYQEHLKKLQEKKPTLFNSLLLDMDTLEEIKDRFKSYGLELELLINVKQIKVNKMFKTF